MYLLTRVSYLIVLHVSATVSHHQEHFTKVNFRCYSLQFSEVVGHIKVLKILHYINFKNILRSVGHIKVLKKLDYINFLTL
jgi:hypothetical protein